MGDQQVWRAEQVHRRHPASVDDDDTALAGKRAAGDQLLDGRGAGRLAAVRRPVYVRRRRGGRLHGRAVQHLVDLAPDGTLSAVARAAAAHERGDAAVNASSRCAARRRPQRPCSRQETGIAEATRTASGRSRLPAAIRTTTTLAQAIIIAEAAEQGPLDPDDLGRRFCVRPRSAPGRARMSSRRRSTRAVPGHVGASPCPSRSAVPTKGRWTPHTGGDVDRKRRASRILSRGRRFETRRNAAPSGMHTMHAREVVRGKPVHVHGEDQRERSNPHRRGDLGARPRPGRRHAVPRQNRSRRDIRGLGAGSEHRPRCDSALGGDRGGYADRGARVRPAEGAQISPRRSATDTWNGGTCQSRMGSRRTGQVTGPLPATRLLSTLL